MKKFYLPFCLLFLTGSFLFLTSFLIPGSENEDNMEEHEFWPRKFETDHGKIVIYQSQPDSLEGNTLKGRAAFSMTTETQKEPVFGAMWFESTVDIDREKRTVEMTTTKIPQIRIAETEVDSGQKEKLIATLQNELNDLHTTCFQSRDFKTSSRDQVQSCSCCHQPEIIIDHYPFDIFTSQQYLSVKRTWCDNVKKLSCRNRSKWKQHAIKRRRRWDPEQWRRWKPRWRRKWWT